MFKMPPESHNPRGPLDHAPWEDVQFDDHMDSTFDGWEKMDEPVGPLRIFIELMQWVWWAIIATAFIAYGVSAYLIIELARRQGPAWTFLSIVALIGGMVWVIQGEKE